MRNDYASAVNPLLLRSFLAVFRQRSFTRAAEQLALTQPAVSRQIRQLEQNLGVVLLERIGKSVQPTDAGRMLAPLAEQLLGQMERMVESVRGHQGAGRGRLRVGASTTPGYYLLPPVLGQFHRLHPVVDLQLVIESTRAIEQRILRNELDLGVVGAASDNETLRVEPVADDEIVCICGPSHPLAAKRRVSARSLSNVTWIVREPGSATRRLFEQWLAAVGAKMHKLIELNSPEAIKALVRAGIGVSFMSSHGVKVEFRTGQLKRVNLSGLRLTRPIYLVRHADKHMSPAMCSFLDLLTAQKPGTKPGTV